MIPDTLLARSRNRCELCASESDLAAHPVEPRDESVVICGVCRERLDGALDPSQWFGLREAAWSEHPAVQVLCWRLLQRIDADWAKDLLDQLYLEEDVLEWAKSGAPHEEADAVRCVDSNGTPLRDGDAVTLIKDLDVKGAGFTAKRGTLVKNIQLGGDPELVEGRVNKVAIYLRTEFLKRA